MVNASDPEVGGSSPTRVKPCCVLEQGTFTPQKVNFLTPENYAVIHLKFKLRSQILGYFVKKDANGIANSVYPECSDLGLHCLPRPFCPKTCYGKLSQIPTLSSELHHE